MQPETQNQRLEPTGLAKHAWTYGLTSTGPGFTRQEAVGRVFGRFWNNTVQFLLSESGPLAVHLDQLLTLIMAEDYHISVQYMQSEENDLNNTFQGQIAAFLD